MQKGFFPRLILPISIAHFKAFSDFAWVNMHQRWLKIALNHLFEHQKWITHTFGEKSCSTTFGPTCDPCNPTPAPTLCTLHHSSMPKWGIEGCSRRENGLQVIPFIIIYHHMGAQRIPWQSNTTRERGT